MSDSWIFKPVKPLAEAEQAQRKALAEIRGRGEVTLAAMYERGLKGLPDMYKTKRDALDLPEMLTIDDIAARLGCTPEEYRSKAAAGQAILFRMEPDFERVPVWALTKDNKIDEMLVDLAREYVTVKYSSLDNAGSFLRLMRGEVNIAKTMPGQTLKSMFAVAGLDPQRARLSTLMVPLSVVLQEKDAHMGFKTLIIECFESDMMAGGWDSGFSLSHELKQKYGAEPRPVPPAPRPL